jgi:hypothetical protein
VKKIFPVIVVILLLIQPASHVYGQCSICTKTAQQLGEKPAQGLNTGIIYLAFIPFAILGVLAYRFFRTTKEG